MKTTYLSSTVLLLLYITFLSSCEKDNGDTTKPLIEVSGPVTNDVFYIGNEIHFEVDFSDNEELKSYKIDIHDNFNGHTHKNTKDDGTPWHFQKSWDFEPGQKNAHIHHHEIVIPTEIDGEKTATGNYHFMIYCTDAEGNESWTPIAIEIQKPTDSEAPVISNIVVPEAGKSFSANEKISVSGTITDNEHLEDVFVAIMPEGSTNEQVNPSDCFAVMLHEHDVVHGKSNYAFTATITVGQEQDNNNPSKNIEWTAGNYYIIIKSPDESGNVCFSKQYPIIIE